MQTDNPSTAEIIMEAAAEVFAEKGYDGARVDELARAAGVNKATLYYQVGDKEAIYHAVLERVLGRTVDEIASALEQIDDCEERIRRFISIIAKSHGSFRYMAPIMLREVASGGRNLPESVLGLLGRFLNLLATTIDKGISEGLFRKVDSFMVHLMIVGSLNLYSANEPIRRKLAQKHGEGHPSNNFATPEQSAAQVSDLILAAIRKHEGSSNE